MLETSVFVLHDLDESIAAKFTPALPLFCAQLAPSNSSSVHSCSS